MVYVDVGGFITPPKKPRRITKTDVEILNYEKLSASVRNYEVEFKIWLWETLISFIRLNTILLGLKMDILKGISNSNW